MNITEKHPVVQAIMDSEELEDEDKIIALNGLIIQHSDTPIYEEEKPTSLSSMFIWSSSYLKNEFWLDINTIVFNNKW
jgi:hypothetical protein